MLHSSLFFQQFRYPTQTIEPNHPIKYKNPHSTKFILTFYIIIFMTTLSQSLTFKQLDVKPGSLIIDTVTTYTVFYDRTQQNFGVGINVTANPVPINSTVTVTFPTGYNLDNNISVNAKLNGGGTITANYSLSGKVVTVNGLFPTSTILSNLTLYINNVRNPSPAFTTDPFTGTIGIDFADPIGVNSIVVLVPDNFTQCYMTFNPKFVNRTSAMQIRITTKSNLPIDGIVEVVFPSNQWSQGIVTSATNYLPIVTSMTCGTLTSNVKSTLQCRGFVNLNRVTASNMFTSIINAGDTFSFEIRNFLSPPTTRMADLIKITAYDSLSNPINQCSQYISDLLPNQMNQSRITITNGGQPLTVNLPYTIRFIFQTVDVIALTDYYQIQFPAGSNFVINPNSLAGQLTVQKNNATYANNVLRLYLSQTSGLKNYSSPYTMYLSAGTYTAPPSIQPTSNFKISILRNGAVFQVGYQSITAVSSVLTASLIGRGTDIVNRNTTYTFSVTINDALSSTGKIRIRFPIQLNVLATGSNCATVNGTNLASTPVCVITSSTRTIDLTSINSSNSIIGAQTFTVTISGIQNPLSQAPMSNFEIRTFYKSNDESLVSIGSATGIASKQANIDVSNLIITASSSKVLQKTVTYTARLTAQNQIPTGGTISLFIPKPIIINTVQLSTSCKRGINTLTTAATSCNLISQDAAGYLINFTNPFSATGLSVGQFIALQLTALATNPPSTSPVFSFKIMTYLNSFAIASLNNSISVQMIDPTSLTSAVYSRDSAKNYDITNYHFTIKQVPSMEPSSVVTIEFPINGQVVPNSSTSGCRMTAPIINSSLICTLISPLIMQITLPSGTTIGSDEALVLTISNVRNPTSFRPIGDFNIKTFTSNSSFKYAIGKTSTTDANNIASSFITVQGGYDPTYLDASITLTLSFQPAIQAPNYLRVSIPGYFDIGSGGLSCSQVANFGGVCNNVSTHTIKVTGNFTSNGITTFQIQGFRSKIRAPTSVQYVRLSSFTIDDFQLDQSIDKLSFAPDCVLPCQTCDSTEKTSCLSCYNNTLVTDRIIYDNITRSCYSNCPDGKYQNPTTKICQDCNGNCKTCQGSPTFCTTCKQPPTSTLQYLNVINISSQVCVAQCQDTYYPDTTKTPVTCTFCSIPCKTCSSLATCITCLDTYYFWNSSCSKFCPTGSTVPDNVTGRCEVCDTNCLTCSIFVNNCTSCNASLILYQNKCIVACLLPLVYRPQILTCGPCDTQCKTCDKVANNCTSCDPVSTFKLYFNFTCLTGCPDKYYATTSTCLLCSSLNMNCDYCINSTYCDKCNLGYVFFQGQCLNYTPVGYVNISGIAQQCTGDCATCTTTTSICTSCKTLNLNGNVCQPNCPASFIPINRTCTPCSSPCLTCSQNVDNCTSCNSTLVPRVYLIQNRCETLCPDFYFADNVTSKCLDCQVPCLKCTSLVSCTSCAATYFLYQGTNCIPACPSLFVGINRICQACISPCKTCVDATRKCLTCQPTFFYLNSTNDCLNDCGQGLFKQFLNQTCISCTAPCKTCINTTNTCLSCLTGILYNNKCLGTCPAKKYNDTNVCQDCPTQCSSCVNNVNCSGCIANYSLYNNFCISKCPDTHAVLVDGVCTKCSATNCHKCFDNDVCYNCISDYSLLKGACLSFCPGGYRTNGTHCNQVLQSSLSSANSNMFPVPFTIATCVVLIACLMSKLQNPKTFIQGAVFALVGIIQTLALMFYIYLYFVGYFGEYPIGLYVALASLGILYLLNFLSFIQSVVLCYDKSFCQWRDGSSLNKCYNGFSTFVSILLSHKFKNLMFSRLFSFHVFSAHLDDVKKFKIFNIFSFISLLHSGSAIFSVITIIKLADPTKQFFHACMDVLIVTGLNIILAFFNVFKGEDYFNQVTPQGLLLNKKVFGQTDSFNGKISMDGNDMQNQQGHGYYSKIQHTLASNQAFQFKQSEYSRQDLRSNDQSLTNIQQKQYQQVSVQAYDILNQPSKDKIDFSTLKVDNYSRNSKFTTIFENQDKSIQKYQDVSYADRSIQNTIDPGNKNQISVQYSNKYKNQPKDVSIQDSFMQSEKGVQKHVLLNDRSIQQTIQQKSWAGQNTIDAKDVSIQKEEQRVEYNEISDQLHQDDESTVKNQNIFYIDQEEDQGDGNFNLSNNSKYNQLGSDKKLLVGKSKYKPHAQNKSSQQQPNPNKNTLTRQQLPQSKEQQFNLPNQDIKQYEQQLESKILQKQKMLQKMRKQIQNKQTQSNLLQEKLKRQQEQKARQQQQRLKNQQQKPPQDDKFTMMRMTQNVEEGTSMDDQQMFLYGQSPKRGDPTKFVVDMSQYIKEKQIQSDQPNEQDYNSIKTKAKPNKNTQKVDHYQNNRQFLVQASKKASNPLNIEREQTLSNYGSIQSPSKKQPGKIKVIDDSNRRIQDQSLLPLEDQNNNKTQNFIYQIEDASLNQDESSQITDFKNNISNVQTNKNKANNYKKQQGTILNKNSPVNTNKKSTIQQKQSLKSYQTQNLPTNNNEVKQQIYQNQPASKQNIKQSKDNKTPKMILDQTNANQQFNDGQQQQIQQENALNNGKQNGNNQNKINFNNYDDEELVEFDSSQDIPQGLNLNNKANNQPQSKKYTQSDAQDYQIKRKRHKRVLSKQQQLKEQQIMDDNNNAIINHQQLRQSFNQQQRQKSRLSKQKKKQIPKDNKETMHVNITKLNSYSQLNKAQHKYPSNKDLSMEKNKNQSSLNNSKGSLFANAAKNMVVSGGDLDNQVLNKKPSFKQNPLVTNKKWEHNNVNKDSIDPQDQEIRRPNNFIEQNKKNQVNRIPHSIPFQTDKDETSFSQAAIKAGFSSNNNQLMMNDKNNQNIGGRTNSIQKLSARELLKNNNYADQVEVHFERQKSGRQRDISARQREKPQSSLLDKRKHQEAIDRPQIRQPSNNARLNSRQISSSKQRPPIGYNKAKSPLKPTLMKQFQSQQIFADESFNPDEDLYSESNDDSPQHNKVYKQQRNNVLIGKMMQRPQNDDLYEYYNRASTQKGKRNKGSKQRGNSQKKNSKSKQKDMKANKQLQKIYMQRLDISASSARNNLNNSNQQSRYNL